MATYSYTGPNSDMEKVRLRIGDTSGVEATSVFSNEEITYFLSITTSILGAAVAALRTVLASKALLVRRAKIFGYETEEYGIKELKSAIEGLEEELAGGGLEAGRLATDGEVLDSWRPDWLPDDETGIGVNY